MWNEASPAPGVTRQRGANEVPWLRSPPLRLVRMVRALLPFGLAALAAGWIVWCGQWGGWHETVEVLSNVIDVMMVGLAILAAAIVLLCLRRRRRSFLVWLTADLLMCRLFLRTPDVSTEAPRGARRVRIRGRLRGRNAATPGTELLRAGYDDDTGPKKRGFVLEAIRPFDLVGADGSTTGVDVENVHLAALPFGAPLTSADVVLHDGDEVLVLGDEDVIADATAAERLDRETPVRRHLRGSSEQPILVLPTGASAEGFYQLRADWVARHATAAVVIALGLGMFTSYARWCLWR